MKTIALLLLSSSVTLAGLPFALAAGCLPAPHEEVVLPADEAQALVPGGTYLHISTTSPEKSGVWTETNGYAGLQTTACRASGVLIYRADTPVLG